MSRPPSAMLTIVDPRAYSQAFLEASALLTRHWRLTVAMARRDLTRRHSGQMLGALWVIGHPVFLTALYIFTFAVVFKVKLGGTVEMPLDYTAYILSGLIPWLTFQTAMSASCSSIVANAGLVRQFVFHLEVLPAKDVLASLVTWFVGIAALLLYSLLVARQGFWTWLLVPLLFVLQLLAMIGIGFLCSAISVYFRDLRDFVTLFASAGIYLVPVVYLPDWVPAVFKPVLYLNPFSYMIWAYQDALYYGRIEHPWAWAVFTVFSLATFSFGYRVFRRLKPMFANAL